jgi:hypothetical protein
VIGECAQLLELVCFGRPTASKAVESAHANAEEIWLDARARWTGGRTDDAGGSAS